MAFEALKRSTSGPRPVIVLFVLLLTSLYLMSGATQNSATFGRLYSLLLLINAAALLLLITLILRHLGGLVVQYRQRAAGSRLTVRLVLMFIILSLAPVTVVYYFALQFLNRGIDSWFDVRVEQALEDALELGQTSLDSRLRELLRQTRQHAKRLSAMEESRLPLAVDEMRQATDAAELTLLASSGKVIFSSSNNPADIVPTLPDSPIMLQIQQGLDYAALEPISDQGLFFRIALNVPPTEMNRQQQVLHALYPAGERLNRLADSVQNAYSQYKELTFLRQPLKQSFTLTLSLILLLSLLTAVWAAFFSARRLVAPIRDLAEGTRAVAAGNYDKRLPLPGRDELGFLVRSFNEMTRKIALARDEAGRSQVEVEAQKSYLEAVLGHLSSGVLSLNSQAQLLTTNQTANLILAVDLDTTPPAELTTLAELHPALAPLFETIRQQLQEPGDEWRKEVTLFTANGRQVLMCRGSSLPAIGSHDGGYVIVFDDVTTLIQAQRDAAWGEVARRLAHEIKNPLTPIRLSAERLRHKYLHTLPPEDAEVLDRSTHTIVQQVDAMKEMVKAFSDYARPPSLQLQWLSLNQLVAEVLDLYHDDRAAITTDLDPANPVVEADSGRMRQLLHNLLKNALESMAKGGDIEVTTRCIEENRCRYVELAVADNGSGISEQQLLGELFEPYVTGKVRGSGLGLAIVKKIVEEHGGLIRAENRPEGGAVFTLTLPVKGEYP